MTEALPRPPFQASVIYFRIPDFDRRPVAEQARMRAQLDAALAVALTDMAPRDRLALDAADGVLLLVLRRPGDALRLAERTLNAGRAGLALAIGINHGAVRIEGEAGETALSGDGLAAAATVAGFTPPASVWMSRPFRDALAEQDPGETMWLRTTGVFTDAGLRHYELYTPDRAGGARRRRLLALAVGLLILAILGGSTAYRALAEHRPRPLAGVVEALKRQFAPGGQRGLPLRLTF